MLPEDSFPFHSEMERSPAGHKLGDRARPCLVVFLISLKSASYFELVQILFRERWKMTAQWELLVAVLFVLSLTRIFYSIVFSSKTSSAQQPHRGTAEENTVSELQRMVQKKLFAATDIAFDNFPA